MIASIFEPPAFTQAEIGVPQFTGATFNTSAQAIPIPLMWGTRRLSLQLIWQSTLIEGLGSPGVAPITGDVDLDGPNVGGTGYTNHLSPLPFHFARDASTGVAVGHKAIRSRLSIFDTTTPLFQSVSDPDPSNSNCRWHVPMIFALCEGPVDGIIRMWTASGKSAVDLTATPYTTSFPGPYSAALSPPAWFYTLFPGSSTQAAWPFFAAADAQTGGPFYTGFALAYRGTAYLASAVVDCGHSDSGPQQPPQHAFDVVRTPNTAYRLAYGLVPGAFDYSMADIIPDFLMNQDYGMGLQSSDIDSASLLTFKQYLFAQGLYHSPLLDSQTAATDIIDRWAMQSNSWIYYNGSAIVFVPLGDETLTGNGQTYTPDATPAYNLGFGDFLDTLQVDRADPIDCYNRVRIEISSRINDYATTPIEWKDETLIAQFGIRDASDVSCDDICDPAVGAKIVELYGKRLAYLRNTYTFTLSYRFILLLPGTIVTLTDPNWGLNLFPVRVRSVQEDGKGKLTVVAEEYPGSLGISRPRAVQPWSPSGGSSSGGSGSGGSTPTGTPVSTSGGGLTMTSGPTPSLILFVAGDVITLPLSMNVGVPYTYKHDQLRVPQPTPAILEDNAVTFQIPTGATYLIEDPNDGTLAPAASVKCRGPSGLTLRLVNTGDGIVRCVQ